MIDTLNNEWITRRMKIISYLQSLNRPVNLKEIKDLMEYKHKRDLIHDIESINYSLKNEGKSIKIIPAQCIKCGFLFKSRDEIKIPTKCPKCKSERIIWPSIYL